MEIVKNTFKLFGACVMVFFAGNLLAQDFEVAPVRLEFDAEPSMSQTKTVTVKNHSNRNVSFSVVLSDFLPSSIGEYKMLPPNSTKRSCANWISINPSFFELAPNDEIAIQVTMLVPGEDFGTSWCMLYVQPTREQTSWNVDKALSTGVTVTGRIGVLIFQSPKSNTNQSIKISNMVETTSVTDTERKFSATIENLGDKVTKCKVFLMASNMLTEEEKQFDAQEIEVFPKMTRNIELTLPNTLTPGNYALATIVDYGPKYPLEGTQIVIEVKGAITRQALPDTTSH